MTDKEKIKLERKRCKNLLEELIRRDSRLTKYSISVTLYGSPGSVDYRLNSNIATLKAVRMLREMLEKMLAETKDYSGYTNEVLANTVKSAIEDTGETMRSISRKMNRGSDYIGSAIRLNTRTSLLNICDFLEEHVKDIPTPLLPTNHQNSVEGNEEENPKQFSYSQAVEEDDEQLEELMVDKDVVERIKERTETNPDCYINRDKVVAKLSTTYVKSIEVKDNGWVIEASKSPEDAKDLNEADFNFANALDSLGFELVRLKQVVTYQEEKI